MSLTPHRQLAAIMFTDMVGYTALMQENEQLALQRRKHATKIFRASLKKHNGTLLQWYGDGTLSMFSSARNAVASAVEMQTLFLQEPRVEVRIGIHTGDVLVDQAGIYGDGVNIASRIESLATPGAVFVSDKVFDEIKNQEGFQAQPLGFFELKNVHQPIAVYAISNPGIIVPGREDVKGKVKQTTNSIAVLPFTNFSADPENEYFCDGITEELINVLARMDGLQVTSRTSSFAFKGKNEDVRSIAAKLSVQRLIEGSVRKSGEQVRVTAQLINAADGYHIWSETFDRDFKDIFHLQDELSRTIANKLRINFTVEAHEAPLVKVPTENMEAYKKYLQGLHYYDSLSPLAKNHAIELFEEAVRLDPALADAHGILAIAYSLIAESGNMNMKEAQQLVMNHVAQAMKSDPENGMSILAVGSIKLFQEWDFESTRNLLEKAIRLNPNNFMARTSMAEYYHLFLEEEKAFEEMMYAYRLNPLSPDTIAILARLCMIAGRYEDAMSYARESLELNKENVAATNVVGYCTGFQGDWNGAVRIFEQLHETHPNYPLALMGLGFSYVQLNRKSETEKIIQQMEAWNKQHPEASIEFILAFLYVTIGHLEKFYENYEACIQKHSFWIIELYPSIPMQPVWYDDRVIESRKKLGLPCFKKGTKEVER